MGIARLFVCLALLPQAALADLPQLSCADHDGSWQLELSQVDATFAYLDRNSDMQVMQQSIADGQDWPIAMTVVGPRDSGIVIVEAPQDDTYPVRILTQRGETPILLAGFCQVTD